MNGFADGDPGRGEGVGEHQALVLDDLQIEPGLGTSSPLGPRMTIRLEPPERTSISACDTRQGGGQNHLGSSSGVVQHLNSLSAGTSMMRVRTSSRSAMGQRGWSWRFSGIGSLRPKDGRGAAIRHRRRTFVDALARWRLAEARLGISPDLPLGLDSPGSRRVARERVDEGCGGSGLRRGACAATAVEARADDMTFRMGTYVWLPSVEGPLGLQSERPTPIVGRQHPG
jgi:hypothetical protein